MTDEPLAEFAAAYGVALCALQTGRGVAGALEAAIAATSPPGCRTTFQQADIAVAAARAAWTDWNEPSGRSP